jgi:hypothetical protein
MYGTQAYAAQRGYGMSPMVAMGADAAPQTTMDKVKEFLNTENSVVHVQNKWLATAGLGIAVVLYGSSKGWFGRRRRF